MKIYNKKFKYKKNKMKVYNKQFKQKNINIIII